jgi:hypothetical protein
MSYYFLGALISPLDMDKRPEISWNEFHDLLKRNLSDFDLKEMCAVLRFFDLENLRLYLRGAPLMDHGNLSVVDFDSLFIEPELLEPWWQFFLEKQGHKEKSIQLVSQLQHDFFADAVESKGAAARVLTKLWKSQWMAAYVRLEMKVREGVFSEEPGINHELIQQWIQEFQQGLGSAELETLKAIWKPSGLGLDEIAKNYVQWQIHFFEPEQQSKPFELEALLGYLIQLAWLERWQQRHLTRAWDPRYHASEALKAINLFQMRTPEPTTHG